MRASPTLDTLARVSDDNVSFWPSVESVRANQLENELQIRIAKHYKRNSGQADAAERFFKSKQLAADQDAQRTWRRR